MVDRSRCEQVSFGRMHRSPTNLITLNDQLITQQPLLQIQYVSEQGERAGPGLGAWELNVSFGHLLLQCFVGF